MWGGGRKEGRGDTRVSWVACGPTLSCRRKLWPVLLVRAKEDTVSHSWRKASECSFLLTKGKVQTVTDKVAMEGRGRTRETEAEGGPYS